MGKQVKRQKQYVKSRSTSRTMKEWWNDQPPEKQKRIKIITCAVCAALAIILFWYIALYSDGSLAWHGTSFAGASENWLIGEKEKGKNSSYYKIAEVDTPEGYTVSESSAFGTVSDANKAHATNFTFSPVEDNGIKYVAVSAVRKEVDYMAEYVQNFYLSSSAGNEDAPAGTVTDLIPIETDLGTGKYFTAQTATPNSDTGITEYYQSLVMYIPTEDPLTCVLISVTVEPATAEGFVTDDVLLAAAENVRSSIHIETSKK